MEKYARWNDPISGMNPFAPATVYAPVSLYMTGAVLLVLRIPLLILACTLLGLASLLCAATGFFRPLSRLLQRVFEAPCARLVLFILGYWTIDAEYAQRNRLRLRVFAVANTSENQKSNSLVSVHGLWQFLYRFPHSYSSKNPKKLHEVVTSMSGLGGGAVCVFPEGVASNGAGILMFHDIFANFGFDDKKVHIIAFSHPGQKGSKFSAALPVGSKLKHVLWHCAHFSHQLRVTMLPAQELSPPPSIETEAAKKAKELAHVKEQLAARAMSGAYGGGIEPPKEMPDPGTLGNRVRDLMARMLKVEKLQRCSKDFPAFFSYWSAEQSGIRRGTRDEVLGKSE